VLYILLLNAFLYCYVNSIDSSSIDNSQLYLISWIRYINEILYKMFTTMILILPFNYNHILNFSKQNIVKVQTYRHKKITIAYTLCDRFLNLAPVINVWLECILIGVFLCPLKVDESNI
jgi:hypothetical protein